jgi:hypothetical protein
MHRTTTPPPLRSSIGKSPDMGTVKTKTTLQTPMTQLWNHVSLLCFAADAVIRHEGTLDRKQFAEKWIGSNFFYSCQTITTIMIERLLSLPPPRLPDGCPNQLYIFYGHETCVY